MRHIFTLLKESAANEEKLTHLEHAEDHVLNAGAEGYQHAKNTLNAVHKTLTGQKGGAALYEKMDGSPSIVFGHHPATGQFFVATKSAFNKEPKLNYDYDDVQKNHGHAPGLVNKLNLALYHLPKVTPKTGIFQGDVMHAGINSDTNPHGDVNTNGKVHSFKPNLVEYHAPANSEEGQKVSQSQFGIAVHTGYKGGNFETMKADYDPDLSHFNEHPDVHVINNKFDSTKADYNPARQADFQEHMAQADELHRSMKPEDYKKVEPHLDHIKTYINKTVRDGTTPNATDLYDHVQSQHQKEIAKVKTQGAIDRKTLAMNNQLGTLRGHSDTIDKVFQIHHHLQQAKDVHNHAMAASPMFNTTINGQPSKPEGYVAVINNRPTKVVDRAEFSRQNFAARQ